MISRATDQIEGSNKDASRSCFYIYRTFFLIFWWKNSSYTLARTSFDLVLKYQLIYIWYLCPCCHKSWLGVCLLFFSLFMQSPLEISVLGLLNNRQAALFNSALLFFKNCMQVSTYIRLMSYPEKCPLLQEICDTVQNLVPLRD